jgi:hypothetical protein
VARESLERRTVTKFKKTYGTWVYVFQHEMTEFDGDVWVNIAVRRKPIGSPYGYVGRVVHQFQFESLKDEVK